MITWDKIVKTQDQLKAHSNMAGLNLEHFWGWLSGSLEYFGNKSNIFAINQEDLQAKIHTVLLPIKSSQNPDN